MAVGEVSSEESFVPVNGSGRSEREKLFCFLPFKPGECDLWERNVTIEGRSCREVEQSEGWSVAKLDCSVIGHSLCGVCCLTSAVGWRKETGTGSPLVSQTVLAHECEMDSSSAWNQASSLFSFATAEPDSVGAS